MAAAIGAQAAPALPEEPVAPQGPQQNTHAATRCRGRVDTCAAVCSARSRNWSLCLCLRWLRRRRYLVPAGALSPGATTAPSGPETAPLRPLKPPSGPHDPGRHPTGRAALGAFQNSHFAPVATFATWLRNLATSQVLEALSCVPRDFWRMSSPFPTPPGLALSLHELSRASPASMRSPCRTGTCVKPKRFLTTLGLKCKDKAGCQTIVGPVASKLPTARPVNRTSLRLE